MEKQKVIYFNWGMVAREAFGKKGTSELGLGGKARFHFDRGGMEKGLYKGGLFQAEGLAPTRWRCKKM